MEVLLQGQYPRSETRLNWEPNDKHKFINWDAYLVMKGEENLQAITRGNIEHYHRKYNPT